MKHVKLHVNGISKEFISCLRPGRLKLGPISTVAFKMSYNEILRLTETENEKETLWKYKKIQAHEGPLTKNDKSYNGSSYNVMIEWENGEVTCEPLSVIAVDDPVACTQYAMENDLSFRWMEEIQTHRKEP